MKNLIISVLTLILASCSGGSSSSSGGNLASPTNPIPPGGQPYESSVFKDLPASGSSDCYIENNTAKRSYIFKTPNGLRKETDHYASGSECNIEINFTEIVSYSFLYSTNEFQETDAETVFLSVVSEELQIFNNQQAIWFGEQSYYGFGVGQWDNYQKNNITCLYQHDNVNQARCAGDQFNFYLTLDRVNSNFRLDNIDYF